MAGKRSRAANFSFRKKLRVPQFLSALPADDSNINTGIEIDITFLNGKGEVTISHQSSAGQKDKTATETSTIKFPAAVRGDILSINGLCVNARLTTNRVTDPVSDSDHPRKYEKTILDNLDIR